MEMWKDIIGFDGYYQISNLGNVKSLKRDVSVNGGIRTYESKTLKPMVMKDGYLSITLWKGSKSKSLRINRLVA